MAGLSLYPHLMGAPQKMQYGSLASLLQPQAMPQQAPTGLAALFGGGGAAPDAAPASGGFRERVGGNLRDLFSSDNLGAWAAMAGGRTMNDSMSGFLAGTGQMKAGKKEEKKQAAELNKTMEYLRKNRPDLASMVEAGMPISDAWTAARKGLSGDDVNYSLTPVYGTDPKTGKTVLGTVGSDGSFKTIDTGGFDVASGLDKVDAGTKWLLYDKRTGQLVGEQPKDLRGAEREKEIGTAEGKSAAAASGDYQAAQNALALVDELLTDPNRQRGTGGSAVLGNWIPSSRGYDYQNKVNQAKSGAFLSAIQQLRGMGALSNAEGDTATKAITRMDTATSEEAFVDALMEYRRIIEQGMAQAQRNAGKYGVELPPASAVSPSGNTRLRYNPATGELE